MAVNVNSYSLHGNTLHNRGYFLAFFRRAKTERKASEKRQTSAMGQGAEKIISMEKKTKFAEHETSNLKTASFF